jgi:hypothetical protein
MRAEGSPPMACSLEALREWRKVARLPLAESQTTQRKEPVRVGLAHIGKVTARSDVSRERPSKLNVAVSRPVARFVGKPAPARVVGFHHRYLAYSDCSPPAVSA